MLYLFRRLRGSSQAVWPSGEEVFDERDRQTTVTTAIHIVTESTVVVVCCYCVCSRRSTLTLPECSFDASFNSLWDIDLTNQLHQVRLHHSACFTVGTTPGFSPNNHKCLKYLWLPTTKSGWGSLRGPPRGYPFATTLSTYKLLTTQATTNGISQGYNLCIPSEMMM